MPLLSHLRRITSSGDYIPLIDGFRFIAISWVMLHHLNGYLQKKSAFLYTGDSKATWISHLSDAGNYGVQLFFIISGFILALPFAKQYLFQDKPVLLTSYYLRRLTRLEPPYMLSFLLLYLAHFFMFGLNNIITLFPALLAGLTYTSFIFYPELNPVNCVSWSLEIEIQFYLLVPFLVHVFKLSTFPRRLILVILMASFGSLEFSSSRLGMTIFGFASYFLGGFLLADLYLNKEAEKSLKIPYLWDAMAITCLLLFAYFKEGPYLRLATPFVFTAFYFSVMKGACLNWLLTRPLLTTIGGMCYSIYLLHFAAISAIGRLTKNLGEGLNYSAYFAVQAIVVFIPVLLITTLYYILIERPCMDKSWPKKLKNAL